MSRLKCYVQNRSNDQALRKALQNLYALRCLALIVPHMGVLQGLATGLTIRCDGYTSNRQSSVTVSGHLLFRFFFYFVEDKDDWADSNLKAGHIMQNVIAVEITS